MKTRKLIARIGLGLTLATVIAAGIAYYRHCLSLEYYVLIESVCMVLAVLCFSFSGGDL